MSETSLKLVIIGDSCGKSSILYRYINDAFNEQYTPTVFEDMEVGHVLDGKTVGLRIFDTSGQEVYDQIRKLSYNGTNVIFMAFSVVNRDSFENINKLWYPEKKKYMPRAKIILLGTKCDLKWADQSTLEDMRVANQSVGEMVSVAQGNTLAKQIGAVRYIETSALTGEGIQDAFDAAVEAGLMEPRAGCCQVQ